MDKLSMSVLVVDQNDLNGRDPLNDGRSGNFALLLKEGSSVIYKYPIATPDETLASIAAFSERREHLPEELVKVAAHWLNVAAKRHHGMSAFDEAPDAVETRVVSSGDIDWESFAGKMVKAAEVGKGVYALTKNGEQYYDISSPGLLNTCMEWFVRGGNGLSPEDRSTVAKAIVKRAHDLSITPHPKIKTAAGDGINPDAKQAVARRRSLLFGKNEKLAESLDEIVSMIDRGENNISIVVKLAAIDEQLPPRLRLRMKSAFESIVWDSEAVNKTAAKRSLSKKTAKRFLVDGVSEEDLSTAEMDALILQDRRS